MSNGFTREDDNLDANTQQGAAPQDQAFTQTNNGNNQPENNAMSNSSIHQLLNMASPTILGNSATGSLMELEKHVKEILEKNSLVKGLEFLTITDSTYLAAPTIILYRKTVDKVFYFAIIPAALVYEGRLDNLEEYVNGAKTVIDMPPSKIYDADFNRIVQAELRGVCGQGYSPFPASYYVIPRDAKLDEERTAKICIDTAQKAINESINPTPAPTADALRDKTIEVRLRHEINDKRTTQFVDGEPIAADIVIRMVASAKKNETKGRPNSGGQSITLSRLAAKIDFFKIDPRMGGRAMMAPQPYMAAMPMPAYHPMLVITELEGMVENSPVVLENQATSATALVSLAQLAAGRNWASLMEVGKKHPRRLGLFGYDHEPITNQPLNPRELVVEKSHAASKPEHRTVNEMLDMFFHPNSLTVAWDIRDGGRSSWAHQAWLAIANGDADANNYMIQVFDRILGGHFSKMWTAAGGGMLVMPQVTIVHNGYFTDSASGEKHDIRELDYLYMLASCKEHSTDHAMGVNGLMHTYAPGITNGNEGIRVMDARRKILLELEPTTVITGISRRLYSDPKLFQVLGQAAHAAGLQFNPEGLYDDQANQNMAWHGFVPGHVVDPRQIAMIMQPQFGNGQSGFNYSHNPYMAHNGWGQ